MTLFQVRQNCREWQVVEVDMSTEHIDCRTTEQVVATAATEAKAEEKARELAERLGEQPSPTTYDFVRMETVRPRRAEPLPLKRRTGRPPGKKARPCPWCLSGSTHAKGCRRPNA